MRDIGDAGINAFLVGFDGGGFRALREIATKAFAVARTTVMHVGLEITGNLGVVGGDRQIAEPQIFHAVVAELGAIRVRMPAVSAEVVAVGRVVEGKFGHGLLSFTNDAALQLLPSRRRCRLPLLNAVQLLLVYG